VKYAFIGEHRREYRVRLMCRILQVSRSGYYAWLSRPESGRSVANCQLLSQIRIVHDRSRRLYGSPRVTAELRDQGYACNEKRVARLMRIHGIKARTVGKFKVTTDSKHSFPVAPNLLDRQFTVARPNAVWVSDITYIWTSEGWLYLAGVVDLYSRQVVGWAMSRRVDGQLTLSALRQAIARRHPGRGLLHHSDQGKQYAAGDYRDLLTDHGMVASMSRAGDCWDNAVMESFFGTLKTEMIYFEKFSSREEAEMKIFEYIEVFYNRQRRHSTLGQLSPVEFERRNSSEKNKLVS
jgi:putative transposase